LCRSTRRVCVGAVDKQLKKFGNFFKFKFFKLTCRIRNSIGANFNNMSRIGRNCVNRMKRSPFNTHCGLVPLSSMP
jgi:hypothetical protein